MAGTDFSHLTTDELIKGIKALKLPDYIRSKAYGIDVRETLAQMTEMLMQLAYNQGMDPQQAKEWVSQLNNKIVKGQVTMSDLTQEVKEALTGGAVAVVGVDAVGTENVKSNAITQPKLADTYTQNGEILNGSLSSYTRAGSYQIIYSSNITDLPTGFKQSGHLFNAQSSGGWTIQLLSTISGDPKLYYRTLRDNGSLIEEWVLINQDSFGREKLANSFMSNREFLSEGVDLNKLYSDGLYVALGSVSGQPSELTGTFFLEVKGHLNEDSGDVRWVLQDIYRFGDYKHLYTRFIDTYSETTKDWKLINQENNTDLNNLTRKHKITQDRVIELSSRNPFKYKEFDKAYITIVWDDGRHDLDKIQEVYKDYPNIPMSLAIPSDVLIANKTLDGTTAAPKLQTVVNEILADPKNELLSHGKTSGAITANRTAEWVDDELGMAQVDYTNLGYDVDGMMLSGATDPQGVYSASNYDDVGYGYIAKRYYAYGDNLAYDEPYITKRTSIKTMADMQNLISDAITNKKWIAFFAHTMDGSEANNTEENHRALLDYILGLEGIEFTTYRHMYETFGSTDLEERLKSLEI